jgi:hypothetical protein
MNSPKLAPVLLIPFIFTTLACPTRPIDKSDSGSGGAGGEAGAPGGTGGHAGATAGESGAAGSTAGIAGAGGASAGTAGGVAGAAGGMAGAAGGMAGAGGLAGATGGAAGIGSGLAGAAGGIAGAAGGLAGATGGMTGLGGATGTGGALADGQPCSLATNCASQVCTGFYVDVDGDGYGTGQAVGFCGTTAPVGYASQSGDCCDNAPNLAVAKLIHPGQETYQTTSAGGVCGITWDYDCSGAIDTQLPTAVGCGSYPDCAPMTVPFPASQCGQSVTSIVCKPDVTNPVCDQVPGLSGTLGCK